MISATPHTNPLIGILADTSTGWGRRLLQGVLNYEQEHGPWHVWVESGGRTESLQLPFGWKGDGVIARISNSKMAEDLAKTGIPVVNISGIQVTGTLQFPRVSIDYQAASEIACSHFLDRGFRHFGYVGPLQHSYVKQHHHVFEQTLEERGLKCHHFASLSDHSKENSWELWMSELMHWLQTLPKPVGIHAWGEDIGRLVIHACIWSKLSVPHDVAVLGSDYDEVLCNASHPPLSGVLTPAKQFGQKAAELLDQMMQGKQPSEQHVVYAPEGIVTKASTDTLAIEDPQLVQALSYIRENACRQIDVQDILRKVPMARRSLERKFQQAIGRAPSEEIRRLRIAKARSLLAETDLSMQAIAEASGYSTYNYLTYAFKRETGSTPSAYRKSIRNF